MSKYNIGDFVKFVDRPSDQILEGIIVRKYYESGIQMMAYDIKVKDGFVYHTIFETNIDAHINADTTDQTAKADAGKLQLTLVPTQIIKDIAEVRMYGNKKYGNPDNWKTVEESRYRDAAFRHFLAYLEDPDGVDDESGIAHLKHLACNVAFLCEFAKERADNDNRGSEETSGENNR